MTKKFEKSLKQIYKTLKLNFLPPSAIFLGEMYCVRATEYKYVFRYFDGRLGNCEKASRAGVDWSYI